MGNAHIFIPPKCKIRRGDQSHVCEFSIELDVLLVIFKEQGNRSSQMLGQIDTMYYQKKEYNAERLPHLQDGPKNEEIIRDSVSQSL